MTQSPATTIFMNSAPIKAIRSENSGLFKPQPWSVVVDGECMKPGTYTYEDIINPHRLEERIYRLRCVEAWSMVIPWVGIPLADVLKRFEPTSQAKYVAFTTVMRPTEMPGAQGAGCWTGPTGRDCVLTRPCIP